MKITVTAKPGAKTEKVEKLAEGHYAVSVREKPTDGKANRAIERVLAGHLGLRVWQVTVASGQTSRQKTVDIDA